MTVEVPRETDLFRFWSPAFYFLNSLCMKEGGEIQRLTLISLVFILSCQGRCWWHGLGYKKFSLVTATGKIQLTKGTLNLELLRLERARLLGKPSIHYSKTSSSDFWKCNHFIHALNHVLATLWDMHAWSHFNYFGSDSDNIMDNCNRWYSWFCCFRRQSFSSQLPLFSLLLFFTKDMSRWNKVRFRPLRTSKCQLGIICDAKWHRWEKRNNHTQKGWSRSKAN